MDTVRAFFAKSGHFFFDFQNTAGESSLPLVARMEAYLEPCQTSKMERLAKNC